MKKIIVIITLFCFILFFLTLDWTKLAVIPFFYICIKKGFKEKYWYNPYLIFLVTLMSYLLFYHRIAPILIFEISFSTNLLILACFLAIILGFQFIDNKNIISSFSSKGNENFLIVFFIGILPTAVSYFLYGNILDVTEGMEEAKASATIPMLSQLGYFLPASIIVACKNNNNKQVFASVFFSILAALLTVSKTGMVMALLFLIIGISYFSPSFMKSKLAKFLKSIYYIWLPILVIFMFAYNNNLRNGIDSKSSTEWISKGGSDIIKNGDNLEENLYLNYLYFCSPWSNLQYNITNNKETGYGANTFAQFGKKIGVNVEKVEKLQPAFLNTHTFIADFYLDFGYLGAVLFSFFLGVLIFYFYKIFCFSGDALLISYYVIVCFAQMMLFFSNHFNNGYLLNYFITMVGYVCISRLHNKSNI